MKQILALLLIGFALFGISPRDSKKVVQLLDHPPLVEPLLRKLNRRLRRRQLSPRPTGQGPAGNVVDRPTELDRRRNESKSFMWRSPGGGMQLR